MVSIRRKRRKAMLRWMKALLLAGIMAVGGLAVTSTAEAQGYRGWYGGYGGMYGRGYYSRPYYARPYSAPYAYRSYGYYRPYSYGAYRPYSYGYARPYY
jgi:hypothetical protein